VIQGLAHIEPPGGLDPWPPLRMIDEAEMAVSCSVKHR